jgi:hypothetical protein
MKSIGQMIELLDGLRDTSDITPWENGFITSILESYLKAKKSTSHLTERQVETIEKIYNKHFA